MKYLLPSHFQHCVLHFLLLANFISVLRYSEIKSRVFIKTKFLTCSTRIITQELPAGSASYVWVDLTNETSEIKSTSGTLEFRALPLSFGPSAGAGELHIESSFWQTEPDQEHAGQTPSQPKSAWLGQVGKATERLADRVDAGAERMAKAAEVVISSEAAAKISKQTAAVGKSLGRMFANVGSNLTSLAKEVSGTVQSAVLGTPSVAAREVLERQAAELVMPVDPGRPDHRRLLERLWKGCGFGPDPMLADSPHWKQAGFTNTEVRLEFAKCGVLGLRSLVYFLDAHKLKVWARCLWAVRGNIMRRFCLCIQNV